MRWGWLVALSILASACAPAGLGQTLSEPQFRDRMEEALKAKSPDAKISATGPLQLNMDGGAINLDTGYAEYLRDKSQLASIIDKWVTIRVTAMDDLPEDVAERVVYVVRHSDYATPKPLPSGGQSPEMISRPLAGDMIAVLMVDYPTMLSGVTPDVLTKAGLKEEDAWRLAAGNLKKRLGPIGLGDLNGDGPFALTAESGLGTGLLAHPDGCSGPNAQFNGRTILVLDRNTFIMTLPEDPLSVQRFWAFAKPGIAKHDFSSDTPITCKNGKWEVAGIPL
jgi:hypothetical protein